jgi:hypothetical protein
MKLNKKDILRKIDVIAGKLRCEPHNFVSMEGKPDINAAEIRLNRLGKCLECGLYLFEFYNDGVELDKNGELHYKEFIRYLKECHDAFEIGRKPDKI